MYAGVLANVSILSMFLAVPVGFLVKLVAMNTGLSRKPFDFFLCHYKLESGAILRLLHMRLAEGNLKPFIDWEDLTDLDTLFVHVRTSVDTLSVLSRCSLLTSCSDRSARARRSRLTRTQCSSLSQILLFRQISSFRTTCLIVPV